MQNTMGSDEAARVAAMHGSFPGHNDSAYRLRSETKTHTGVQLSSASSQVGGKMGGDDLEEALDDIYERHILFLGRFELYSQVCFLVSGMKIPSTLQLCHPALHHAWLQ